MLVFFAGVLLGGFCGLVAAALLGAGARSDEMARADFLEGECARLLADRDAAYERGRKFVFDSVRAKANRWWDS